MENKDSIFTDIENTEVEASYLQRLFISFVDLAVSVLLILLTYKVLPEELIMTIMESGLVSRLIFIILIMEAYRLPMLLIFGKTLGMMVCKVKYLNGKMLPLTAKENLIASFIIRTASIRYYKNNGVSNSALL